MTKMWRKKGEILELLRRKPMTVSDVSRELGLAVSTTSQHIAELKDMGAVVELDIGHTKKWRYYKPNPNFQFSAQGQGGGAAAGGMASGFGSAVGGAFRNGPSSKPVIVGTAVAAVAIISMLLLYMRSAGGTNAILFSLTDPPTVPNGTQALMMNFSSIQAHETGPNNQSSWAEVSGGGTVNLLDIVNSSKVIGLLNIPDNVTIDALRFNINSARIEINGTLYNVSIPDGQVTADILPQPILNSSSEVMVDLFPTVNAVYGSNETSFVLLLTVKAVTFPDTAPAQQGVVVKLRAQQRSYFMDMPQSVSLSNITIEQGNSTGVYLTVKSDVNTSLLIRHVLVVGPTLVTVNATAAGQMPGPQQPTGAYAVQPAYGAGPQAADAYPGGEGQVIIMSGAPPVFGGGLQMIGFIVQGNGTMDLERSPLQEYNSGYILAPGASAALSFSGNMVLGNGGVTVRFVPDSRYRVLVVGQDVYAQNSTG